MERLESYWLAGKRHFLFSLFCAVVRHREKETGRRTRCFLVAKPVRLSAAAHLQFEQAGLGFHFRLRVHLDSLYSKPDDPSSAHERPSALPAMWSAIAARCKFLLYLWKPPGIRRAKRNDALITWKLAGWTQTQTDARDCTWPE